MGYPYIPRDKVGYGDKKKGGIAASLALIRFPFFPAHRDIL